MSFPNYSVPKNTSATFRVPRSQFNYLMPTSKRQAGIHEVVHILTELVRDRGDADEELLSQFPAGPPEPGSA